MASQYGWLF
ncbi:uncharacterized protein FFE2_16034 [Fusarium fujikuroi]|nr:uncharacterized protein FFE2_16034 [Fusarium fujikuroi]